MTKPKVIIPFNYEALEALTGPALIEKIKFECDSESADYLKTIERFIIEHPHPNSNFRFYQVFILSRSCMLKAGGNGTLRCHYFSVDNALPNDIGHFETLFFLIENFHKLCKGFEKHG